jgi:nucleotide-binding universal stress UspA family protein
MKLLLPVDGSAPALAAVRQALRLVQQGLQASFVLVNVQEPPSLYEVVLAHDAERLQALRRDAGADLLQGAEALLEAAGVDYESEVAGGNPGHLLLERIEDCACDLVVMGARGMGMPEAGDLGSVALDLLRHSPVPVLLVRLPAADVPDPAPEAVPD